MNLVTLMGRDGLTVETKNAYDLVSPGSELFLLDFTSVTK